ncbi:hypothetical protein PS850_05226 [Pseudomonas fluorescens]|nr:hypothetical protein PS850_05226 [Pseudomonas fluorescens]
MIWGLSSVLSHVAILPRFSTGQVLRGLYADDFIITGYSKEWLENEVRPAVFEFLAERGLVLFQEKTKITHIGNGFDFLGWNVRKYNGKLPSKANISAHLAKLRELAKNTAQMVTLFALSNMWMARRYLLANAG